jgi:hypothetical protein
MKRLTLALATLFIALPALAFEKGEKLVLLSNLHPDMNKQVVYTMNYQLPTMMPMCDEVTVVKQNKKKFIFDWKGVQYTMIFDGHTKKTGIDFETALGDFFGKKCDSGVVAKMSEIDKKGIKRGMPLEGMTRQGILYAMGRPPRHVNPDLEAYTYMYWLNRFKRKAIEFDDNGIVENIRL